MDCAEGKNTTMLIIGILALIICVIGLVLYLALSGMARGAWVEVARVMFAMGLLAFLLGAGMQSCSVGTTGSSAVHR